MANGLTALAVHLGRQKFPAVVGAFCIQKRDVSSIAHCKRGRGGRSSFSGVVATVFGASGFFGRIIVNRLGKTGTQVIIPHRGDSYNTDRLKVAGDLGQIMFMPYDSIFHEDQLRKAMVHSNLVINLIGREWETRAYSYKDIYCDGPALIAKIAKEMGVERLIHISHFNAAPDHPDLVNTFNLEKPRDGMSTLQAKYEGDIRVREAFPEAIIFKPTNMYGYRDNFLTSYLSKNVRKDRDIIPLWREGKETIKQPVYVADVATCVTNAIFDPSAPGNTYYCMGPHRYNLNDLIQYVFEVSNYPKHMLTDLDYLYLVRIGGKSNRKNQNWINLDSLNREAISDGALPEGVLTMADLGVTATALEDNVNWVLREFRHLKFMEQRIGREYTIDGPPRVQPEINKLVAGEKSS